MKTLALIVNPVSGRGLGLARAERAQRWLEERGARVERLVTAAAGDATAMAAAAGEADAIVAVGGDGTLREVVEGSAPGRTLGLIPAGTANVVARDLGIPRDGAGAARILLEGKPRPLDLGRANDRTFIAMVGAGFDAAVVREVCERRNGPISFATYVRPALTAARRWKPVPIRLTVDGTALERPAYGVVVSNTRNYGGHFSKTPDAEHGDGVFDFVAQLAAGPFPRLRYSLASLLKRRTPPGITRYGRGRKFEIDADIPVPVQVDGDYLGTTPVSITLVDHPVMILSPETSS